MITEDDLRQLLAEAAASAPPPGPAPDALVAALEDGDPPVARRLARPSGRRVLAVAAVVLLVLVGVNAVRSDDPVDVDVASDTFEGDVGTGGSDAASRDAPQSIDLDPSGGTGGTTGGSGTASPPLPSAVLPALATAGSTDAAAAPTAAPAAAYADSARIVKTGSIDLEVREGAFTVALEALTSRVVGLGGYVSESTTSQSEDAPSGAVVVRVPEASFEALLTELRKLGEVQSVTSKGTDVSAQFTDINARLAALTATRDRLSTVLREASNVGDIIMVQDRITAVQTEIETYQGQLHLLEDQAAMATLAVTLREPGADLIELGGEDDRDLGGAWDDARRRFGDGIEDIVAGSGTAAVVLLAGGVLVLIGRLAWPRLRRRLI